MVSAVRLIADYRTNDINLGGISNFFNQLIVSFGYTNTQSLLLGTPGGAVEVVALVVAGYLGDRFRNRLVRDKTNSNLYDR